jgi:hypothetical protein
MAIYFLDVDDEVTSAAARIRDSSDNRIALVLAGGSRVATSRINFRLLAREARQRHKRLAIITADASVQSVARTAELPVYATVGEYERSEAVLAQGGAHADTKDALDELAMTVSPRQGSRPSGSGATRVATGPAPTRPAGSGSRTSPRLIAAAAAAVLLLVLVAALGFFFYPSATVVLTLREDTLGPTTVNVTVDPGVVAADDLAMRVPGLTKAFPVTASGEFTATGQTSVDTAATGTVTFSSINTLFAVPVVAGTPVSTTGGIQFVTTQSVTVPMPTINGNTITRGTADAPVQAVVKGVAGNVAAARIVRLSTDLVNAKLSVTNKSPTTGGTHTVTPFVQQSDIDAAETSLLATLNSNFQDALNAPAAVPTGSSLFPETARLGVAVCNPDPAGLLNQAVASFSLDCQATGTATMADMNGIVSMAERKIRASVKTGYSVVESSLQTSVGDTAVQSSMIVVPVTVQAAQVPVINTDKLRSEVLGKSLDEARTFLAQYGKADISLSPDWSSSLPSFDFRIDFQLVTSSVAPSFSPPASATPGPTVRPTAVRTPVKTAVPGTPSASPGQLPSQSPGPSQSLPAATATPTPTPTPAATPTPTATPTATPAATPTPS